MPTEVKCAGCDRVFPSEAAVNLHLSGSTMCPKSSKYDEAIAKEKDTKCPHCQLPCRGEEGVKAHLRRSKTCPGGSVKSKTADEKKVEKKERKPSEKTEKVEKKTDSKPAADKKTGDKKAPVKASDKVEKKSEKKTSDKTEKKTDEVAEKKPRAERKPRTPLAKDAKCDGCGLSFRGERGVEVHQGSSTVCPKSAKYSKEAADASKERLAKRQSSPLDTKCPHCETSHRGEKGLETHLAKSATCPKSAKYDPSAKKKE